MWNANIRERNSYDTTTARYVEVRYSRRTSTVALAARASVWDLHTVYGTYVRYGTVRAYTVRTVDQAGRTIRYGTVHFQNIAGVHTGSRRCVVNWNWRTTVRTGNAVALYCDLQVVLMHVW